MNLLPKIYFFAFLICFHFSCQEKQNTNASNESLLKAIENFNQAFQVSDINTLESMITDNYIHSNGNSKAIGKEVWLNYLKKRNADIEAGILKVTNYKMAETEIERYNDSAILTAKISIESTRNNEVQTNEYRVTNIWVYQNGQWKRAGFHDGKIK